MNQMVLPCPVHDGREIGRYIGTLQTVLISEHLYAQGEVVKERQDPILGLVLTVDAGGALVTGRPIWRIHNSELDGDE